MIYKLLATDIILFFVFQFLLSCYGKPYTKIEKIIFNTLAIICVSSAFILPILTVIAIWSV